MEERQKPTKLQIGDFRITFIDCGRFRLDGGSMFSVVPRVIWEKTNPADDKNRIEMATNAILIEDGKQRILVENGLGDKFSDKFRSIYDVENRTVVDGLSEAGITPEEIDHVINTHLHFDHIGGNTILKDGQVVPTFPNATYHSQRVEWEWAKNPSVRDRASYIADDFLPLEKAGQLKLYDGDSELAPGICLLSTPGHNAGHQSVLIQSEGDTALFMTDLCPTSSHLPLPYIMSYDLYPLKILETKKRIFDQAVKEKWKVLFYHDPQVLYGEVTYSGRGRIELADAVLSS